MPLTTFIECPVLSGIQAGGPQYAAVWSLDLLLRLTDDAVTRVLNDPATRLDVAFIRYLAKRLTADAQGNFPWSVLLGVIGKTALLPHPAFPPFSILRIDPNSEIAVLDGLHRLAALRRAALPLDRLQGFSVPVVIRPVRDTDELLARRTALASHAQVTRGVVPRRTRKARRGQDQSGSVA